MNSYCNVMPMERKHGYRIKKTSFLVYYDNEVIVLSLSDKEAKTVFEMR